MNTAKYTCRNCIWYDNCGSEFSCEYFSASSEDVNDFIESERISFSEEWNQYIEEMC